VEITRRRVEQRIAHDATMNKMAQAAIHGGKKGHNLFDKIIKRLTGS
jgi:hypothetical protein